MSKILVVEDDRNLLDTLQYNLRREGYDVITSADGENAVEAVARFTGGVRESDVCDHFEHHKDKGR